MILTDSIFWCCCQHAHCVLFSGVKFMKFYFYSKFFQIGKFFSTFHCLFKGPIYCAPCSESLKYVLCNVLTCWEEHKFESCC